MAQTNISLPDHPFLAIHVERGDLNNPFSETDFRYAISLGKKDSAPEMDPIVNGMLIA